MIIHIKIVMSCGLILIVGPALAANQGAPRDHTARPFFKDERVDRVAAFLKRTLG
jgi:hypothetical protein